jgi:capsular exopolysaccharide synthesis family protein
MIEQNSVLDEIRRLHEEHQTGVLLLANRQGERINLSFCEGMMDAVSSNKPTRRLGDYLAKEGYLTTRTLDSVQSEAQRQKIVIGEAIVRKKLVDQGEVGLAVRRQSLDLIEYALKDSFKVSSFTNSLRSYYVPARITFPHILLELSRHSAEVFELEGEMQIVLNADVDPSAYLWGPEELCVLNEVQQPRSFASLLKATGLGQPSLKKILGILERVSVIKTVAPSTEPIVQTSALALKGEFSLERLIPVVTNAVLDEKLEVARNEFSFASEQFRNLKIQLRQAESEIPLKVFTVSSPDAQDGKSLVSANLAFTYAQDPGCKVLIIDCDLRKPSLEKYLGVPSEPGLLQYLSAGPLGPHCFLRRVDNLYFMTAGGTAPNPIEVLSMRKMKHLVEYLRNIFDTIILDAPPYSPIADARVVTALSDGLIMVIRSGKTAYASTDRAFKAIDQRKLVGVVLNDVKPMPFQTYHDYNYYEYGDKRVYAGNGKDRGTAKTFLGS